MIKIGLTGNICTGKTTAAWMFEELGAVLINADTIAHDQLAPHSPVWKALFDRYGKQIMLQDGIIDKKALAGIIFSKEAERKFVESLIHPKVHEELLKQLTEHKRRQTPMIIVEVPLLFETKWDKEMDCIIVVRCDLEQQIARCQEKFGLMREEALARIHAQKPMEEKVAKADYVIDNAGSKSETLVQVRRIFQALQKNQLHPKK